MKKVWNSVLAECKPLMVSLGNIEEQLRAFQKIQIANTSLHTFPDLAPASSLQAPTGSGQNGRYMNIDTLATCTQRSAVAPSIADMLEWLQDAGCYYRQQFLRRKNVLRTLRADDLCLRETAPKRSGSLKTMSEEASISGAEHLDVNKAEDHEAGRAC